MMPPLPGHPPTQTPEMNQVQFAGNPERSSAGLGLKAKAGLMIGGALSSAAILAPGAAAAEAAPSVDTEKAALAAFGNNAITRSVDSFPASEAQASAGGTKRGKAVSPGWIMKQTLKIYFGNSYDDPTRLYDLRRTRSTAQSIVAIGKCNPKNPYDPYGKSLVMRNGKVIDKSCPGGSQVQKVSESPEVYALRFSKMGSKAATSAGISAESRGSTTKAIATSRRATISFANDDTEAADRQLKTLVLRTGKKPTKQWYPPQTTEAQ